jgi:hypothetical protein
LLIGGNGGVEETADVPFSKPLKTAAFLPPTWSLRWPTQAWPSVPGLRKSMTCALVGPPLFARAKSLAADVAGTFVYDPVAGTQLGVGDNQPLDVAFTPDDTGNYNLAGDSVTIDVLPNQPASYTASDPAPVLEDVGLQTVVGFISWNVPRSVLG